jgi:diguanylate cyclase (GGDEF)-like protein
MPDLDGVELCRRLRHDPVTADVQVVFCSAQVGPAHVARALAAGGNDYIGRPYDAVELTARLRAAVRMKRAHETLRRHIRDVARSVAQARDPLAQVWDRRYLFERIEQEGRRAQAQDARAMAAILIALDDADVLRERHGQAVWDRLIRELAERLVAEARPDDMVSRYGSAEFLVLLPEMALADAQSLAERHAKSIREKSFCGDAALRVTVSAGVAHFDERATEGAARVIRAADAALFLARRAGGAQVKVYRE